MDGLNKSLDNIGSVDVLGSSLKITFFGHLKPARVSLQKFIISASPTLSLVSLSSINAQGVSPHFSSGLATTAANASGGTLITITAVGGGSSHTLIGQTPTATATLGLGTPGTTVGGREIAHVGWVKKTIGTGGRAGRVHYETLVAASSITGDGEDLATPDE